MPTIQIGVVGIGKIARDQHLPALAASTEFTLAAVATHHGEVEGIRTHRDTASLLQTHPEIEAVSFCTPPVGRHELARQAIEAGRHVMLEKPPGATVAEVERLADLARTKGVTLFCSWHSREAAAVGAAREWLSARAVLSSKVTWKEDVRRWHPGQEWIWEPGGLGVFDPGINALSILTHILPEAAILQRATLFFPSNRSAPIAVELGFCTPSGAPVTAEFDWRQTGPQTWDVEVQTDQGLLSLTEGGSRLFIDGVEQGGGTDNHPGEYPALYSHFAALIRQGRSDVDLEPFRHVADAFMLADRRVVEAFEA